MADEIEVGKVYKLFPPQFRMATQSTKCDEKGRLYLKRSWRQRVGEEFFVVVAPRKIILLPVPEDPVADLAEIGKALPKKSTRELRSEIRKQAEHEVEGDLR